MPILTKTNCAKGWINEGALLNPCFIWQWHVHEEKHFDNGFGQWSTMQVDVCLNSRALRMSPMHSLSGRSPANVMTALGAAAANFPHGWPSGLAGMDEVLTSCHVSAVDLLYWTILRLLPPRLGSGAHRLDHESGIDENCWQRHKILCAAFKMKILGNRQSYQFSNPTSKRAMPQEPA